MSQIAEMNDNYKRMMTLIAAAGQPAADVAQQPHPFIEVLPDEPNQETSDETTSVPQEPIIVQPQESAQVGESSTVQESVQEPVQVEESQGQKCDPCRMYSFREMMAFITQRVADPVLTPNSLNIADGCYLSIVASDEKKTVLGFVRQHYTHDTLSNGDHLGRVVLFSSLMWI